MSSENLPPEKSATSWGNPTITGDDVVFSWLKTPKKRPKDRSPRVDGFVTRKNKKQNTLPDKFFHKWNHPKNDWKISKVGIIPNKNPRQGFAPLSLHSSGERNQHPAANKNFGRKIKSALFGCFFVVWLDSLPLKTASKWKIYVFPFGFQLWEDPPFCCFPICTETSPFGPESIFFLIEEFFFTGKSLDDTLVPVSRTYGWIDWFFSRKSDCRLWDQRSHSGCWKIWVDDFPIENGDFPWVFWRWRCPMLRVRSWCYKFSMGFCLMFENILCTTQIPDIGCQHGKNVSFFGTNKFQKMKNKFQVELFEVVATIQKSRWFTLLPIFYPQHVGNHLQNQPF